MSPDINRRALLKSAGTAMGSFVLGGATATEASAIPLKIGFISPVTGPLGSFGQTDAYVLARARDALAEGVRINNMLYAVEILDRDTQSDPARAGELALELIHKEQIDIMIAVSTPETINPVADACEAAGVPCISTVMPWEAWYYGRGAKPGEPSPYKYSFHFGFGAEQFYRSYASQWRQLQTNKRLGVMYPNDPDGNAMRAILLPKLEAAGFEVIDPGPYESGTKDYSKQIQIFQDAGIEIFSSFPLPPDFSTFWQQAYQKGLHRQLKIVQLAKTGMFPGDLEILGRLGHLISSAAYWHRDFPYSSPVTGLSGIDLCDGYEATSNQQWTQQLGASLSAIDVTLAALSAATDPKDKEAVARALPTLRAQSIGGLVDFNTGPVANVATGPIIGTQWKMSSEGEYPFEYVITENATDPQVPVSSTLTPYNS